MLRAVERDAAPLFALLRQKCVIRLAAFIYVDVALFPASLCCRGSLRLIDVCLLGCWRRYAISLSRDSSFTQVSPSSVLALACRRAAALACCSLRWLLPSHTTVVCSDCPLVEPALCLPAVSWPPADPCSGCLLCRLINTQYLDKIGEVYFKIAAPAGLFDLLKTL